MAYHPEQEENDIFAIGEGVRHAFEEVLVPAGMGDVSIFTELGRFMLGSSRITDCKGTAREAHL